MELVTKKVVDIYLRTDDTNSRLDKFSDSVGEGYVCQRWLRESPAKRYIYEVIYGPLFDGLTKQRVLDIGGGLTGLTNFLAERHEYILADILAHDHIKEVKRLTQMVRRDFIMNQDWLSLAEGRYDLVLANDIFPNVDQRLEIFLEKFIPQCSRIRMLLTWYDTPHYYMTKRLDGEEILCMLAWNGDQIRDVLAKFQSRILNPNFSLFDKSTNSVFNNGRQTCIIEFQGDLIDL
jgi:hypothetical protein